MASTPRALKTNAVIISSNVGDRRIELVDRKSVRRVDFNNLEKVKAARVAASRKRILPFDVSAGHFFRYVPALRVGYGGTGQGASTPSAMSVSSMGV